MGLLFFVIINIFISKLVSRGGFQFGALPGVTIKDFSTKQLIKKSFDFQFIRSFLSKTNPGFFTDCPVSGGGLLNIDPKLQVVSGIPV